jgi:hypothetical protein
MIQLLKYIILSLFLFACTSNEELEYFNYQKELTNRKLEIIKHLLLANPKLNSVIKSDLEDVETTFYELQQAIKNENYNLVTQIINNSPIRKKHYNYVQKDIDLICSLISYRNTDQIPFFIESLHQNILEKIISITNNTEFQFSQIKPNIQVEKDLDNIDTSIVTTNLLAFSPSNLKSYLVLPNKDTISSDNKHQFHIKTPIENSTLKGFFQLDTKYDDYLIFDSIMKNNSNFLRFSFKYIIKSS